MKNNYQGSSEYQKNVNKPQIVTSKRKLSENLKKQKNLNQVRFEDDVKISNKKRQLNREYEEIFCKLTRDVNTNTIKQKLNQFEQIMSKMLKAHQQKKHNLQNQRQLQATSTQRKRAYLKDKIKDCNEKYQKEKKQLQKLQSQLKSQKEYQQVQQAVQEEIILSQQRKNHQYFDNKNTELQTQHQIFMEYLEKNCDYMHEQLKRLNGQFQKKMLQINKRFVSESLLTEYSFKFKYQHQYQHHELISQDDQKHGSLSVSSYEDGQSKKYQQQLNKQRQQRQQRKFNYQQLKQ